MSLNPILKATTESLVSQLNGYARKLSHKLENTRYMSADDFKKTRGLALSLVRQMSTLKSEAKHLGKDISVTHESSFLHSVKVIRTRLNYLSPKKQARESKSLQTRKIKYHQSQSKKLKAKFGKLCRVFKVNSKKKAKLQKSILREVKYHENEMEKSLTRLAVLSKQFSIKY